MECQAPHGSDRRFLRDETVSGVTWTSFTSSHLGCGGWEGVGSLSTGSPSGGGLAQVLPLNVQSGHSKVLKDRAVHDGTTPEKGEGIRWFSLTNTVKVRF